MWAEWVTGCRIRAVSDYFAGNGSADIARATAADLGNNAFVWSLDHYSAVQPPPAVKAGLDAAKKLLPKAVYTELTNSKHPLKFEITKKKLQIKIKKSEVGVTVIGSKADISVARAVVLLSHPGDALGIERAIERVKLKDGMKPIEVVVALVGEGWCRTRGEQLAKTAAALSACKRT